MVKYYNKYRYVEDLMLPEWLTDFAGGILRTIKSISFLDIIDIIGVAFLLYYIYKLTLKYLYKAYFQLFL